MLVYNFYGQRNIAHILLLHAHLPPACAHVKDVAKWKDYEHFEASFIFRCFSYELVFTLDFLVLTK